MPPADPMHPSEGGWTGSMTDPPCPLSLGIASICAFHSVPSPQPTNLSAFPFLHQLPLPKQLIIVRPEHVGKMSQRCTEHLCLYPDKAGGLGWGWLWRSIKIRELSGISPVGFSWETCLSVIPHKPQHRDGWKWDKWDQLFSWFQLFPQACSYTETTPEDKVPSDWWY